MDLAELQQIPFKTVNTK